MVDLEELQAPSNLGATFNITQDNSGMVTITPTGESSNMFDVDFGDGSEIATGLRPGESVDHVYPEGQYDVVVTGKNLKGDTAQGTQALTVSFRAPENLEVNLVQSANNPKNITVSATADYAAMFNVYFGETEDEEPTALMPGETLEYTYAAPGDYDVRVVALSGGTATTEEVITVTVPEAEPAKLPITFDEPNVNYNMGTFGGASFAVVVNPFISGANAVESNVGAITNSGAAYEGGAFSLGEAVDFSGDDKVITMKMYSEVSVPVLLKFEGGVNDERQTEVTATHNGTGWEELSFNFATDAIKSYIDGNQGAGEPFVPTGQYATMVIFVDGPGTTAGTFYIDDIMQTNEFPDCVAETEENIDFANGPINWTFMTNSPEYAFEAFGATQAEIVRNPKTDGINNSCNVGKFTKTSPCETWSGLGKAIPTSIDFSNTDKKIFKMKVLAEDQVSDVTLRLEYEPYPDTEPSLERVAEITQVGEWQELTFDFSDVDSGTFRSVILYFERGEACDGDVYYFDDLRMTDGNTSYISLFSDQADDVTVDTWRTSWSQGDYEEVTFDGRLTKHYTNLDYIGIETVANQLDITNMTHFHLDVYTDNATTFKVKIVDFGPNGIYDGPGVADDTEHEVIFENIAQNQWVSLDIPLSDFENLANRKNIAQFVLAAIPAGSANVYVDDIYFHN